MAIALEEWFEAWWQENRVTVRGMDLSTLQELRKDEEIKAMAHTAFNDFFKLGYKQAIEDTKDILGVRNEES